MRRKREEKAENRIIGKLIPGTIYKMRYTFDKHERDMEERKGRIRLMKLEALYPHFALFRDQAGNAECHRYAECEKMIILPNSTNGR